MHLSEQTAVHRCQELLRARDGRNKLLHQCNRLKLLHITDRQNQNIHLLEAFHFKHMIIFNVVLLLYICFNHNTISAEMQMLLNTESLTHVRSFWRSAFPVPLYGTKRSSILVKAGSGTWSWPSTLYPPQHPLEAETVQTQSMDVEWNENEVWELEQREWT